MKKTLVALFFIPVILFLCGCQKDEPEALGKGIQPYCQPEKLIAKSYLNCYCDISFTDYIHKYTYVKITSAYYQVGPPYLQNVFYINYINSVHNHNEPDYKFGFYLPRIADKDFFKPDTFQIDTLFIFESSLTGGHGGPVFNVDISFIWLNVEINEGIYSGSGKFIINEKIPTSFPGYTWPEQEILFEFCDSGRES